MTIRIRKADKDILEAIRRGEKTIGTRANTPRYQNVGTGQELYFTCDGETITKTISGTHRFPDIKSLADNIDIRKIHPDVESLVDLEKMYYSFPGYKDKTKIHGLVAWELK